MVQTMITRIATFLAAGTSIGRARFIAEEIGDLKQRWALPAAAAEVAADSEMEVPMPYLFWAVVPFELMKMWWDACERARETSSN